MVKITNDNITDLKQGDIFVFGSNESGRHGKGAAKTALGFGAKYGQSYGLQGRTFAIPTVNASVSHKLKIEKVKYYVDKFYIFVKEFPELNFLVTEIGCGLAGFTVKEIAPLFKDFINLENVYLPSRFWRIISK